MQLHAVHVPVSAPVLVECIFWPEDDVWKGASQELSLSVHGSNFEETKRNMEAALYSVCSAQSQDGSVNAINEPEHTEFPDEEPYPSRHGQDQATGANDGTRNPSPRL